MLPHECLLLTVTEDRSSRNKLWDLLGEVSTAVPLFVRSEQKVIPNQNQ